MASYAFPVTVNSTTYTQVAGSSFYNTRNGSVLGIVLHVTAGLQDLDLVGTDGSAEGTAKWAVGRPVSWHVGVDSDSIRPTLPASYTGWHAKGYNSRTVGIEISNLDARWDNKPAEWVTRTLRNAARACAAYVEAYNLPLTLANKATVDSAVAAGRKFGFTYHSYLSDIRVDPGRTFPWARFIAMVQEELGAKPAPLPTNAAQFYCYRGDTGAAVVRVQKIVGVVADGSFGPGTEAAVKAWQTKMRILADGKWGPTTELTYQTSIKPAAPVTPAPAPAPAPTPTAPVVEKPIPVPAPAPVPVPPKPTPFPLPAGHWYGRNDGTLLSHSGARSADIANIKRIQVDIGGVTVDGKFGPATETRVKYWQGRLGLRATGKVDAITWAKFVIR